MKEAKLVLRIAVHHEEDSKEAEEDFKEEDFKEEEDSNVADLETSVVLVLPMAEDALSQIIDHNVHKVPMQDPMDLEIRNL